MPVNRRMPENQRSTAPGPAPRKIQVTGFAKTGTPAAVRAPREPKPAGVDSRHEAINA